MQALLCMQYISCFAPQNPDLIDEANNSDAMRNIGESILLYNKECVEFIDRNNVSKHKDLIKDKIIMPYINMHNNNVENSSYLFLDSIIPVEFIGSKAKMLEKSDNDNEHFLDMVHDISQQYFNIIINEEPYCNKNIDDIHEILLIAAIDILEKGRPFLVIFPEDMDDDFDDEDDDW